jgi:hypothetical protein
MNYLITNRVPVKSGFDSVNASYGAEYGARHATGELTNIEGSSSQAHFRVRCPLIRGFHLRRSLSREAPETVSRLAEPCGGPSSVQL